MLEFQNILIVQTAFPGDIVLTTPLFKNIKNIFPSSRLTVLTTPSGEALLKSIKEIDSLILYDKKGRDSGFRSFVKLIRLLRKKEFDLCISPHRSGRTSLLVRLSRALLRVGYSDSSLAFLYNKRIDRDSSLHEVERILSLLTPFVEEGMEFDKEPYLEVSAEVADNCSELLEKLGVSRDDKVVGVAPGSVWGTKRWTVEGYSAVVDELIERYGLKVLLLGSPAERETGDRILSQTKNKPVDLVGKTSLPELITMIGRCSLLVGNDSAPGHIASAMGVPVISIFGPTVTSFGYYPYGRDVKIVEKDLPCRPCHHHGPQKCPQGHFSCMRDISKDDVMKAVESMGVLN